MLNQPFEVETKENLSNVNKLTIEEMGRAVDVLKEGKQLGNVHYFRTPEKRMKGSNDTVKREVIPVR